LNQSGLPAAYAWSFEPDAASRPMTLDWPTLKKLGTSAEAAAMSKDLKKRGWSFVPGGRGAYVNLSPMATVPGPGLHSHRPEQ
jgi:DNA-3-methyladenine glycosylase I